MNCWNRALNLQAPQGDALVTRFYERLFEKYPAVKPLFKNASIPEQKRKSCWPPWCWSSEHSPSREAHAGAAGHGARHVGYGAKPAHYDAVGENLLAVLGEFAGEALDSKVKQAWTDAYTAIKTIMLAGPNAHTPHKERRR